MMTKMKVLRKICLGGMATTLLAMSAFAQAAKTDAPVSQSDPVLVFNRLCYAQVPVVRKIQDLAVRLAWQPMGGEDLKQFTTLENPDLLEGWDVNLAKRLYRLGIVQSDLNSDFKETFADFADGKATSCTLVLDGSDQADIVLSRMNTLIGKEPASKNKPDGVLLTSTWAGGNEDFKVFVFAKSTQEGKATLLNVTILSKELPS